MFCPKCGTQNPEEGRFCRSCGADLGNVSAAMSGELTKPADTLDRKGRVKSNNPDDIWSNAFREFLGGIGFLIISMVLFFTGVANGRTWWWALLFPAFMMMAKGAADFARVKRIEKKAALYGNPGSIAPAFPSNREIASLAEKQTEYIEPRGSIYETGDLAERPPSVTEATTRHLSMEKDGETSGYPKA